MIQLTEQQLKQIIIDAFNEGVIYDANFDYPAIKYACYVIEQIKTPLHIV